MQWYCNCKRVIKCAVLVRTHLTFQRNHGMKEQNYTGIKLAL